jgi:hypothetical protein
MAGGLEPDGAVAVAAAAGGRLWVLRRRGRGRGFNRLGSSSSAY